MLNSVGYCKLSGFGSSIYLIENKLSGGFVRRKSVTPEYHAPEHKQLRVEYVVDFWALGIANYIMYTNRFPFLTKESIENDPLPDIDIIEASNEAKDFIKNLLEKDYKKRLNSKNIQKHAFIKDVDWVRLENGQIMSPYIPSVVIFFSFLTI